MTNGEAASFSSASLASRSGFLQQPRHQKPETGQDISKKSWQIDLRQNPLKNPCFFVQWRRKIWFFPSRSSSVHSSPSSLIQRWQESDTNTRCSCSLFCSSSAESPPACAQTRGWHHCGVFFQVSFLKHKLFLPIKPNRNRIFVKLNNELFSLVNFCQLHLLSCY